MKVAKGLDLTRESWRALRADPQLLLFPVMSGVVSLTLLTTVVAAGLLIPAFGHWALGILQSFGAEDGGDPLQQALGIACLFVVYFVQWFVVIFFNTALVGCALIRFQGGSPSLGDGLGLAMKRLPQILAWTFLTSLVGTILSAIEQKLGWFGQLVMRFIGLTWTVASYFVVPILAAEGTGPVAAIQRSVSLLKQTWGEGLTGNFVIQVLSSLVGFAFIFAAMLGVGLAIWLESIVIAIVAGVAIVGGMVACAILTTAMKQYFLAALYQYANTGEVPAGFAEESFQHALQGNG
jgi:Family of unknown function (DUF6159)